jgi:hypothetical protein
MISHFIINFLLLIDVEIIASSQKVKNYCSKVMDLEVHHNEHKEMYFYFIIF